MYIKNEKPESGESERSYRLLLHKYSQYLVPTMITYAALSLNEFVDSMLVSNLLGPDAMAIVNIGTPVVLVVAAVYALLGNGGSTVYAIASGRRDHDGAGRSLTAAATAALAAGFLVMLPCMVLIDPLSALLCKEEALRGAFNTYLFVLLLSTPFEIVILTVASFLPSAGYPGLSTAVNVTANVINIVMDYVYIRVFGMGVEGAAWATLTGYICAAVFMAAAVIMGRMRMHMSRDIRGSMRSLPEIITLGRPDSVNQIGLAIQFAVCNMLAMSYGGTNGIVALSLCMQASSVMSVFIGAIIGSGMPLMSVLHGQGDYRGEENILKTSMLWQLIISAAGTLLFWVFAPGAAALYNIKEASQLAISVYALRIYSLMFIPRDAVIVYYRYLKVIGLNSYATVLSALDSFAAVIPAAWIMSKIFGINGLWFSFPAAALILAVAVMICNGRYSARSGGRLRGLLLIEEAGEGDPETILDVTISEDSEDIAHISEKVQSICEEKGIDRKDAIRTALAVEELAVYIANRKNKDAYVDILVRIIDGNIEIDFRSLGRVFDPNEDNAGDIEENIIMLRSVVSKIENDYILGMNSTRITINGMKEQKE